MKLRRKQHLTIIEKRDSGYIVSRAEYVAVGIRSRRATYSRDTKTVSFFGRKIPTKKAEQYYKAVKSHYDQYYKEY